MSDALYALLDEARTLDVAAATALLDAAPVELRDAALWHQARGVLALRANDTDAAIRCFEAACAREPEIAEHRGSLGAAWLEKARTTAPMERGPFVERARTELERALVMGPRGPDVATSLAFCCEVMGDAARALLLLDDVIARFPDHAPALFNRASALKALGRIDEARALLDELIARGFEPARAARARS